MLFSYGTSIRNVGNYLYTIQGGNTTGFYKYDLTKDSWLVPNRGIFGNVFQGTNYISAGLGADIVQGNGDYFYLIRGNYSDDFIGGILKPVKLWNWPTSPLVQPRVITSVWLNRQQNLPDWWHVFAKVFLLWHCHRYLGRRISRSSSDRHQLRYLHGLWRFSVYLYMNRGAAASNFYQFDTQGSSGSKWSTLTSAPAGLGYGAELLLNGGYIYTLRGQMLQIIHFIAMTLAPTLGAIRQFPISTLRCTEGFDWWRRWSLYAARGENSPTFFKYSVGTDIWSQIGNAPANIYQGGSAESNGTNKIFMLSGNGTGSYSDAIYTYIMSTSDSGFEASGSYVSDTRSDQRLQMGKPDRHLSGCDKHKFGNSNSKFCWCC